MKRVVILIIMLFSFSVISLADNARFDARREAKQEVNETVAAFSERDPLLAKLLSEWLPAVTLPQQY